MNSPKLQFVASYPKSGNTWVRMLVGAYFLGGANAEEYVKYDDIGKWYFQAVSPLPITTLHPAQQAMLRPAAMVALMGLMERKVLVKSHHASVDIDDIHLWSRQFTDKVIVVVRDPRDVLPSWADHTGKTLKDTVNFMNSSEATIGGNAKLHHILGSWSDHVGSWRRNETVPTYITRYRDLHADTKGELVNILEFLGVEDIQQERVEASVEVNQFDRMQKFEEENGFPEQSDNQDRFFRKGQVGSWQEDVPDRLAAQIEHDHAAEMDEFGFDRVFCAAEAAGEFVCSRKTGGTPCYQHD